MKREYIKSGSRNALVLVQVDDLALATFDTNDHRTFVVCRIQENCEPLWGYYTETLAAAIANFEHRSEHRWITDEVASNRPAY